MIQEFLFNEALRWAPDRIENQRIDELYAYYRLAADYFKRRKDERGA